MDSGEKTEPGPLNGAFTFKRQADGAVDKSIVLCVFCKKAFSYHRSTSSLRYHLNAKHFAVTPKVRARAARDAGARAPTHAHRSRRRPAPGPAEEEKTDSSGQTDAAAPVADSSPRTRARPRTQQVEREFLEIQRSQFDVLHRDLVVLRRSVSRMESRTVPLLRSISQSLERMADALDYITAPATDGLLHSGALNSAS